MMTAAIPTRLVALRSKVEKSITIISLATAVIATSSNDFHLDTMLLGVYCKSVQQFDADDHQHEVPEVMQDSGLILNDRGGVGEELDNVPN